MGYFFGEIIPFPLTPAAPEWLSEVYCRQSILHARDFHSKGSCLAKVMENREGNKLWLSQCDPAENRWFYYGLTPTHLLIYLGGEGEFYGRYRLRIPLEELDDQEKHGIRG